MVIPCIYVQKARNSKTNLSPRDMLSYFTAQNGPKFLEQRHTIQRPDVPLSILHRTLSIFSLS